MSIKRVIGGRYIVKDNNTGKKLKSLSLEKAAKAAQLDTFDAAASLEEHGRVDTDVHTIRPQSNGKSPFAFG